jgi:hypothetical protein
MWSSDKRHLLGRGTAFLKRWMAHLEEHADLRYPTLDELDGDEG